MIHPIKSLIVRNQNKILSDFANSRYGKQLKSFKDIHVGDTCFIIGNGPSLRVEDLTKIYELGVSSFAFNRVFCAFDETPWRPTYYITQDINVTIGQEDNFKKLDLPNKFVSIRWKFFYNLSLKNCFYYNLISNRKNSDFAFSKDFSQNVVDSPTVAYTAFQLAYYMGFKKIYLIGFDQNYKVSVDKDGNVVTNDKIEKDYFSDKYKNEKSDDLILPNVFKMNHAFISVDYHIKNGDIDLEVYNATRGGMLEVFQRVDVDEVFKELEENKK